MPLGSREEVCVIYGCSFWLLDYMIRMRGICKLIFEDFLIYFLLSVIVRISNFNILDFSGIVQIIQVIAKKNKLKS